MFIQFSQTTKNTKVTSRCNYSGPESKNSTAFVQNVILQNTITLHKTQSWDITCKIPGSH